MSVKHVKRYYKQTEKMYFELLADLHEMEEDFKAGECTEEQLQNLLLPVNNLKENYKLISYFMYLLAQPNRDSKEKKYENQNKDLTDYFKENNLMMEEQKSMGEDALKKFKEEVKKWKENKNG